jgi:small subunit ribosomal protein S4e
MARKGNRRHLKRLATINALAISEKKAKKFITKPMPGRHEKIVWPIVVLLRDKLNVAKTTKEVKYLLNKGVVKVDGKVVKERKYPIGLFDIIDIGDDRYIIVLDKKGRLTYKKVDKNAINYDKPLRIKNKVAITTNTWQLTFHDGRTKLVNDKSFKIGDTVVLDLNSKEIKDVVKPEKGKSCLITQGKHAGKIALFQELLHVAEKKKEAKLLTEDKQEIITRFDYLFFLPENFVSIIK